MIIQGGILKNRPMLMVDDDIIRMREGRIEPLAHEPQLYDLKGRTASGHHVKFVKTHCTMESRPSGRVLYRMFD